MSLHVRAHAPDERGCIVRVTPQSAGWQHVGFEAAKLAPGQHLVGGEDGREACIVVLGGIADIRAGDLACAALGERGSVFEDKPPAAVYAPAGIRYEVTARSAAEIAICTAPGRPGRGPRLLDPATMTREVRGSGTNRRFVRNILPESEAADSLLVVEVITPGGNWSSYPPHKHDTASHGKETALEETYYHRLDPPQGFAFQRVYTDDRSIDETLAVENHDVVMVPRGYHPVGASHGYDLYYLNVMAGPVRNWIFRNDPAHAWIAAQAGKPDG